MANEFIARNGLIALDNSTITGSLTVTGGITGSLFGTSSFALNGGVTQLLAGSNVTLSPTNGLGQVTISSTGTSGPFFNTATGSYGSFYDTTTQTNPVANIPRSMSLNTTDITNGVSVSGSISPFNTYIKTENAGVYNIQFSAQLDKTDGGNDEIVIWLRKNGINLTDTATTITLSSSTRKQVAAWNWFVNSAANDYYQIIWQSADTNVRLLAEPAGGTPGIPSVILTVNRVDQFLSNTGSFSGSFTGQFTGSLFGTASYALTASFALNGGGGSPFPFIGSAVISGSLEVKNSSPIPFGSIFVPTNNSTTLYVSSSISQSTSYTISTGSIGKSGAFDSFYTTLSSSFYIIAYSNQYHSATSPGITFIDNTFQDYFIIFNTASVQSPAAITGYDIYAFNHINSTWYRNINYTSSAPNYIQTDIVNGNYNSNEGWYPTSSLLSLPNNPVPAYTTLNTIGIGKSSSLNGVLDINGNTFITGSLNVSQGITGSLQGSASFAQTASFVNTLNQNVTITGSFTVITGSNVKFQVTNTGVKIGNISTDSHSVTGSFNITGSVITTGSIVGNVTALTIASNTASLNLNSGNFFTLQLVPGVNTFINPSNIKAGQTTNILISTTGSATVSFPSIVKQVSGSTYTPTSTTSTDIITMISFNTSSLYLANVKNLI